MYPELESFVEELIQSPPSFLKLADINTLDNITSLAAIIDNVDNKSQDDGDAMELCDDLRFIASRPISLNRRYRWMWAHIIADGKKKQAVDT